MAENTLTLDENVALIVIDMQEMVRTLPYSTPIGDVITHVGELANAFRAASKTVVTTRVAGGVMTRADRPMTLKGEIPAEKLALVAELDSQSSDIDVPKKHWGAFTDTSLEQDLRDLGTTQVVMTGVATGFGVESTARAASELGFNVVIATDAMSDMNAAVHERSTTMIFPAMAQCRTTAEILNAVKDLS